MLNSRVVTGISCPATVAVTASASRVRLPTVSRRSISMWGAAQQRPDAQDQLVQLDGLDHVVVDAQPEPPLLGWQIVPGPT